MNKTCILFCFNSANSVTENNFLACCFFSLLLCIIMHTKSVCAAYLCNEVCMLGCRPLPFSLYYLESLTSVRVLNCHVGSIHLYCKLLIVCMITGVGGCWSQPQPPLGKRWDTSWTGRQSFTELTHTDKHKLNTLLHLWAISFWFII